MLAIAAGAAAGASLFTIHPVVSAVCLIAFLASLAILRSPFFGVFALISIATLLPFAVLPIRLVFAPTLIDVTLTALLVAWLVRVLHRDEPIVTTRLDHLLVLFIGLAVVSLILGMGQSPISNETLRLFLKLVSSTLLFFSAVQVVRTEHQLTQGLRTLLLGGGAASGIAVVLYALPAETTASTLSSLEILGYPTGSDVLRPVAGTETLRATGTSVDPNILGGLLMLVSVMLVAQLFARRPILPRALLGAIGLPAAIALALTYSRSSWVGLAAGIAFLAVGRERRAAVLLGLGGAAVALLPQGRAIVGRLGEAFSASDPASVMRLAEYRNAVEIISRYPIFGIGFGGAPSVDLAVGVSSMYLTIAEQMGLLGLGCFLTIVLAALSQSISARPSRDAPLYGLLSSVEATLVAALVAGLFDHYFFNVVFPHMVGIFWLLVGLLAVASRLSAPEKGALRDPARP